MLTYSPIIVGTFGIGLFMFKTKWIASTAAIIALAAAFALPAAPISAQDKSPEQQDRYREMEEFLAVYQRIKARYVDKVDDKQLMEGAIQGMLSSLDPHSAFLDKSDFEWFLSYTD